MFWLDMLDERKKVVKQRKRFDKKSKDVTETWGDSSFNMQTKKKTVNWVVT